MKKSSQSSISLDRVYHIPYKRLSQRCCIRECKDRFYVVCRPYCEIWCESTLSTLQYTELIHKFVLGIWSYEPNCEIRCPIYFRHPNIGQYCPTFAESLIRQRALQFVRPSCGGWRLFRKMGGHTPTDDVVDCPVVVKNMTPALHQLHCWFNFVFFSFTSWWCRAFCEHSAHAPGECVLLKLCACATEPRGLDIFAFLLSNYGIDPITMKTHNHKYSFRNYKQFTCWTFALYWILRI